MPISLEYDSESNVIYTTATGPVALADVTQYFSAVQALDVRPGYRVLADYSAASFDLSYPELERMATERKILLGGRGKVRIAVHCQDNLVYGLGRVYRALLDDEQYSVMIFRNRREAKDWLGI